MKRQFISGVSLLCAGLMTIGNAGEIKLAGSSTIQPVVKEAGKAFETANPGVTVSVKGGGSSAGVKAALDGTADIGTVSRALHADESAALTAYTIGHDGIALIVHGSNPLVELTKAQVVAIFSGAVTQWKAVGGTDQAILVVGKMEGRSTKELFEEHFGLKGKVKAAHEIGANAEAITLVAGDPTAIAYVSVGSAEKAVQQGIKLKLLTLDGVTASSATVAKHTYPLTRPLNLATKGAATDAAKQFIDFMLSPAGQAIVEKNDFVGIK